MFNLSIWPHIRTRFDRKQLEFRKLLTLLPLLGFGIFLWGWRLATPLMVSAFATWLMHAYCSRKGFRPRGDYSFINDVAIIVLLMPVTVHWLIPAGLSLICYLLRTFVGNKEYVAPINFPLILAAMYMAGGKWPAAELWYLSRQDYWAIARGNFFFISGWLPVVLTVGFSFLLLTRLYKWRILLSGMLLPLAYVYLLFRAGAHIDSMLAAMLVNLFLFSLGVLSIDHISTPSKRWSQFWHGMFCGFFIFIFAVKGQLFYGVIFSPIIVSLISPLMDKLSGVSMRFRKIFI